MKVFLGFLLVVLVENCSADITLPHLAANKFEIAFISGELESDKILQSDDKIQKQADGYNIFEEIRYEISEGKYDSILDLNYKLLERYLERGDVDHTAKCLHDLAMLYLNLKNFKKATVLFHISLRLKRTDGFLSIERSELFLRLSQCYLGEKDINRAQSYLDSAVVLCDRECSKNNGPAFKYTEALIAFELGNIEKAEINLRQILRYAYDVHDSLLQLKSSNKLAEIYFRKKNYELGKKYLVDTDYILEGGSLFVDQRLDRYLLYGQFYLLEENYKLGSIYLDRYVILKDSIYSFEFTSRLVKTESSHQEQIHRLNMADMDKILTLKQGVINQQRTILLAVLTLVLIIILLAFLMARRNLKRKIFNALLEQRVKDRIEHIQKGQYELENISRIRDCETDKSIEMFNRVLSDIETICDEAMNSKEPSLDIYFTQVEKAIHNLNETTLNGYSNGEGAAFSIQSIYNGSINGS